MAAYEDVLWAVRAHARGGHRLTTHGVAVIAGLGDRYTRSLLRRAYAEGKVGRTREQQRHLWSRCRGRS
jgi:hypothetical protein